MHKALTLQLVLTLWGAMLSAQIFPINVDGTVSNNNVGIGGVEVFITAFFADSSIYLNTVMTNQDGTFNDVFDSPDGQTSGVIMVSIIDCNGDILDQYGTWQANNGMTLSFDFDYCGVNGSGDSCAVLIIQEGVPGSAVDMLFAIPLQGNAVSYLWNTGDSSNAIVPTEQGTYCVTITTANGCTATGCYQYVMDSTDCFVMINPSPNWPPVLYAEAYGTPAFTYVWNTGQTGPEIAPSDPGTYCVTMTDANGCEASSCFTIDAGICEVIITCDPPGTLAAQGTSSNPMNIFYSWNTGENTQTIIPMEEGLYCVTINDNSGCIDSACIYYTAITQCGVQLSYGQIDSGGQYLVLATPFGTPPFNYLWSTGDSTEAVLVDSLSPAICVTMTDAMGCEATQCTDSLFNGCSAWISVEYFNSGATLSAFGSGTPAGNSGIIVWSNGETGQTITVTEPGEYCVTIITNNGCTSTACVFVNFSGGGDSCNMIVDYSILTDQQGNLMVSAFALGGMAPYTYLWSTGATTADIVLDPNTTACVTVTDANGCTASTCVYLDPNQCFVTITADPIDTNVWVLTAFGPNSANYQYSWSNGEMSPVVTVIAPGTYCVTVTGGLAGAMDSCYAEACIAVTIFDNDTTDMDGNISGLVFGLPNAFVGGTVELYQVSTPNDGNSAWPLVDSTWLSGNNFYIFDDVPPGIYAVKAIPENNPGSPIQYLPSYHYSTVEWESADLVAVPNALNVTTDIYLVAMDTTGGSGIITGSISDDDGLLPAPIEDMRSGGIPGIPILLHTADGIVMGYTQSDVSGNFNFDGLPFGQYIITFDVPGISSPELWVTLSASQPALEGLVLSTSKLSSGTEDILVASAFSVHPVPATDYLTVERRNAEVASVDIEVMSIDGKTLARYQERLQDGNSEMIPVGHLQPGLYLIRLISGEGQTVKKWIKQ